SKDVWALWKRLTQRKGCVFAGYSTRFGGDEQSRFAPDERTTLRPLDSLSILVRRRAPEKTSSSQRAASLRMNSPCGPPQATSVHQERVCLQLAMREW